MYEAPPPSHIYLERSKTEVRDRLRGFSSDIMGSCYYTGVALVFGRSKSRAANGVSIDMLQHLVRRSCCFVASISNVFLLL